MRLSLFEIEILRVLARGEVRSIGPAHRVRLEMLGLTKETPAGLAITPLGRQAASSASAVEHETLEPPHKRLDALGRKRIADRTLGRLS